MISEESPRKVSVRLVEVAGFKTAATSGAALSNALLSVADADMIFADAVRTEELMGNGETRAREAKLLHLDDLQAGIES